MKPAIVIYAALSKASDDPDQTSIDSQIEAVRDRLTVLYADGFDVVGVHSDDGYSGSKRNRGPGLERAIRDVEDAAAERGKAELWANSSARFGRGTSRPGEARAIGALFYDLRAKGVELRTVTDDEFVRNEMLIGIGSTIAAKYSSDLSESIQRAKLRELQSGNHVGGPTPDGYMKELSLVGNATVKSIVFDPDRAPIVKTIFGFSAEGIPDTQIARKMNALGHRTRQGRPYTRSSIWATITNPFYAGRVAMKPKGGERLVVDGKHPALIDPADFDRINNRHKARDYATPAQKVQGRPNENHILARLAVCGECGGRMFAKTSSYKRKDGTKAHSYSCQNTHLGTGLCHASPINAELVDQAVVANLPKLFPDFEKWQARIVEAHDTERRKLEGEVDRAETDFDKQRSKAKKVEAQWSEYVAEGDTENAKAVVGIVRREQESADRAERRLQAARDALASVPTDAPTDAMLDFASAMQNALKGRLDQTDGTVKQINQTLRELFVEFHVHETADGWRDGDEDEDTTYDRELNATFHKTRKAVVIQPFARADGDHWPLWLSEADEAPPLQWLSTTGFSRPEENAATHRRSA